MSHKRALLTSALMLAVAGCGPEAPNGVGNWDGTDIEEKATIAVGWYPYVSEESWQQSRICGDDPGGGGSVSGGWCGGSYCDNVYIYCTTNPSGVVTNTSASWWTPYVSDETSNSTAAFCLRNGTIDGVIDGIQATGRYADNMSVRCSPFVTPPYVAYCRFTSWYSEEAGGYFFATGERAVGVQCRGSYCDDMRWYVCKF